MIAHVAGIPLEEILPSVTGAGAGLWLARANLDRLMPKMKSHSGAKKRFKKTATGKVRGRHAFTSHNLQVKRPKRKRRLGRPMEVEGSDKQRVKRLLGPR